MLFLVNIFGITEVTPFIGYIFFGLGLVFIASLIFLTLFAVRKTYRNYQKSLWALAIFLIINLGTITFVIAEEIDKHEMNQISQISNCDEAELTFSSDLKNGKLKFFTFGIVENIKFKKQLEEKYDLKVRYMGCIVTSELECYNQKVKNHFEQKGHHEFFKF